VNAILEEKLRLEVHREGQLQKLELEGTLKLQALEPQRACLQVHLDLPEDSGLVYKVTLRTEPVKEKGIPFG
jgi:hypothetical protein